jgi:hypothetical protein
VREAGRRIFLTEARRHGDQGTTDAACAVERKKEERERERERERKREGTGRDGTVRALLLSFSRGAAE